MFQQPILYCPEFLTFFSYAFPLLIVLLLTASTVLISEIIKTYSFIYPKQRISIPSTIQRPYSLLAQAQEIAEKAEKQLLEKEMRVPLKS